MAREDTTKEDYQRAWRGRHMISIGNWAYPQIVGKRVYKRRHYLRCSCGWRLVNVPPIGSAGMKKAYQLHHQHALAMSKR